MPTTLRISTPATTANLGPGFDCLGLAVNLRNEVLIEAADTATARISGEGSDELADPSSNLVLRSFAHGLAVLGHPAVTAGLRQVNRVPLARGLGSSATAIVAGLAGARAWAGLQPDPGWLLDHATRLEGHPDNVAPAIQGGLTAAWIDDDGVGRSLSLPLSSTLALVVVWPEVKVSTHAARQVMPSHYSRADVTFNLGRLAMTLHGLATGELNLLRSAIADRVHTPYRSALIPGFDEVRDAAASHGAACFISGSGPTMGAFVDPSRATSTAQAMQAAFAAAGVTSHSHVQELGDRVPGCSVALSP